MLKIEKNKELKTFNSFKINAIASDFIELKSANDFHEVYKLKNELPNRIYILGGGNNSLFINDFNGVILKINNQGIEVLEEDNEKIILEVQAGVDWNDLVDLTLQNGYFGIENLIDIPGLVGSAPIQNIGAYGAEIKDVVQSVKFFDFEEGNFKIFSKEECKFGYRTSIFKNELKGKGIISSVIMQFKKEANLYYEYGNIKKSLEEHNISKPTQNQLAGIISEIRASKLPDPKVIGNAGSFFKNPIIDAKHHQKLIKQFPDAISFSLPKGKYKVAAGWLIDKAGWKGKEIGNVAVHSKQALVLINKTGKATGNELMILANSIIESVYKMFQIKLQPEVNIIS